MTFWIISSVILLAIVVLAIRVGRAPKSEYEDAFAAHDQAVEEFKAEVGKALRPVFLAIEKVLLRFSRLGHELRFGSPRRP